jgi:L-iditol 2-dehydrogenase
MNAMQEYIVVEGGDVHAFSSRLDPAVAIMLQPLACVVHALEVVQEIEGSHIAVIGLGSIGVLFSSVAKERGAARVTDIDPVDRVDVAAIFGVDEMVQTTSDRWAAEAVATKADRPDIVIEAVGHQVSTLVDSTTAVADGGQIYYFGIPDDPIYPFPMMKFLRSCGRLYSGYTPADVRRDCLRRAEEHVEAHPELVGPYLTGTYKFADAEQAFSAAIAPRKGQLKLTLTV